jgi:tetratricopeptide (TPR) repeat protein
MICSLFLGLLLAQPDPAALAPLYRQALEEREKQLGPEHAKVARSASDLGLYLKKLGETEAAARYLRRALEIDQKTLGGGHPLISEDLENLAGVVPPEEAAVLLGRAAECRDPQIAARVLGKLGAVQEQLGDGNGAVKSYRLALRKELAASGTEHPRVAVRLNDLALVIEPKDAEQLFRRARSIQQKALGPRHVETAITTNNLANALLATGRVAQAEKLQRSALEVLEAALGREHPRVAVSCSNLANVLRSKGDLAGAKALYRRALAIDEKVYGANHPEVAADLANLAEALVESGEMEEARQLQRRAAQLKGAR